MTPRDDANKIVQWLVAQGDVQTRGATQIQLARKIESLVFSQAQEFLEEIARARTLADDAEVIYKKLNKAGIRYTPFEESSVAYAKIREANRNKAELL